MALPPLFPEPNPDDPLIIQVLRGQKRALLQAEYAQVVVMTERWAEVTSILEEEFLRVAQEAIDMQQAGLIVNKSRIVAMETYQALLEQAGAQYKNYAGFIEGLVSERQFQLGQLGIQNAVQAINAVYLGEGMIPLSFEVLPVAAIENMVGLLSSGSPLMDHLIANYGAATNRITEELYRSVVLGLNPRVTARRMMQGYDLASYRAQAIARTEQLRVYREANRMQYEQSGVVRGYRRLSARDGRVCPACLFADGQFYEVKTAFEEHVQGRCTLVPVVQGMPELQWQQGQAWFLEQPEEVQISILGPGRYDAWRNGSFELGDIVRQVEDPIWGNALVPASLRSLVE